MTNIIPAIDGITIRQHDGLYSLTDLHKASGGEPRHQPAKFTCREETKALAAEIAQSPNSEIALRAVHGGTDRGTYACRELVIAYAAWISPAFHLKVIRVFLDAAAPKPEPLPPLPYKEQRGQSLTEEQCAELRAMLTGGAAQVPEDMRGQFMVTGWSRLKAHFGCSYRKIPAELFEDARDLIARHIADFVPAPQPALPAPVIDPFNGEALEYARRRACAWANNLYRKLGVDPKDYKKIAAINKDTERPDIPDDVLCGILAESLQRKQFIVNYTWHGDTMQPNVRVIDSDAVMDFKKDPPERIISRLPQHRVPELIAALAQHIAPALTAPAAQ